MAPNDNRQSEHIQLHAYRSGRPCRSHHVTSNIGEKCRVTVATPTEWNLFPLIRATAFTPSRPLTDCWFPTVDEAASTTHYVAWVEERPVGVASVYLDSSSTPPAPRRLRRVSILPTERGKGVGTVLVGHVFQFHQPIWASVRGHLEPFYQKLGAQKMPGEPYMMGSGPHITMVYSVH